MSYVEYGFDCIDKTCGAEVLVEIEITYGGSAPSGMCGPYEFSDPGDAAEWEYVKFAAYCDCGASYPNGWLEKHHGDKIDERVQERASEPSDDYYDEY